MPTKEEIDSFYADLQFDREIDCLEKKRVDEMVKKTTIKKEKPIYHLDNGSYTLQKSEYKKQYFECSCGATITRGSYNYHQYTRRHTDPNYQTAQKRWEKTLFTCTCGAVITKSAYNLHKHTKRHIYNLYA